MRILIVSQFFAPVVGGEERLVEDLGDELAARGHAVAVVTTTPSPAPSRDGVRIHRLRTSTGRVSAAYSDDARRHVPPFPDPEAVLGLRRIIAAGRPDVVHAHDWLVHSVVPALGRGGPPLALTLHDFGLLCANKRMMRYERPCPGPQLGRCVRCAVNVYGGPKGLTAALTLRPSSAMTARRVGIFLPVSEAVARLSGLVGSGAPYEVIPNFVPDELTAPPKAAGPAPDGLPDGDYIVFAGDITLDKGARTALDALTLLPGAPPLVMVGRRLPLEQLRVPSGAIQLGERPHGELIEILRRSRVVVMPSLWEEPFGLVALEAMAVGRPVVVTRVGGLVDLVDDGASGLVVPPDDPPALAAALGRLLESPELAERLGRGAAARAREFRASAVVPRVEEVYRRLVRRDATRAREPGGPAAASTRR